MSVGDGPCPYLLVSVPYGKGPGTRCNFRLLQPAIPGLQLSPIATRNTGPATFAYCNPQYRACNFRLLQPAIPGLQLSPIATRNTGPATIAGLPAANPQGLQAVCRAIGRISIPARKLQCCSQSQRGISYDPMTHSLSKWEVTDCPARVLLIWNGIARGPVQSCNVCREHCDLDCNLW